MSAPLLLVLTFLGVVTALTGLYSLVYDVWLRDRAVTSQRLEEEFGSVQQQARKATLFRNLGELSADAQQQIRRVQLRQWLQRLLEQAGVDLSLQRLLGLMLLLGLGLGGAAGLSTQNFLPGVVLGVVGLAGPVCYLFVRRQARHDLMLNQLAEVFELMSRTLRAGHTLVHSLREVGTQVRPPIGREFAFCTEQHRLGLSLEDALDDLAQRTGLLELRILTAAILVQQTTGGNLSELLNRLAHLMRERQRLRGRIKSLTAEGRLQALVLMALPPLLFVILLLLHRTYALLLVQHPELLGATVFFQVLGGLWIRRITKFDF